MRWRSRWHAHRDQLAISVREVLTTWHLQDRWWAAWSEAHAPSDRTYYRVRLPGHQIFDIYLDSAQRLWVLDVVHD